MAQESSHPRQRPEFLSPELLLAAIVGSSDDAIISKNLQGIVTSWNQGAERIFGYTAEEMIGQPILRLLPVDRQTEEISILDRLRRGERVDHFETIRITKTGQLVHVSLTISPVRDPSGEIIGASKVARDITQQKEATAKLAEANENLRRADRMKAEFISTLSHELRTPLNAIVGWLQIMKEDPTPEEIQHGVEVIERNVRAQGQLINDLLDMSRIESGKLTLDIQQVDIPAILTAAMDAVKPAVQAKELRLTATFNSCEGIVKADKNRLQQVVWNLLTNAVKFTEKGGRIHVLTQRVQSYMDISVTDNGIGIAPEYLGHIFERFNQADSSTTRKHGGLGLGLSIAKHLIELHGGTIVAKSDGRGKGATFTIRLPLLSVHVNPDRNRDEFLRVNPTKSGAEKELSGIKILVVDDEPDSADIVVRILRRNGAEVHAAHSAESALKELEHYSPNVLVSDVGMPEHDGYELIRRIRLMPQGRRIAAVARTALARAEDRARALQAGFQMHVAKPVEAMELIAAIRNLASLQAR